MQRRREKRYNDSTLSDTTHRAVALQRDTGPFEQFRLVPQTNARVAAIDGLFVGFLRSLPDACQPLPPAFTGTFGPGAAGQQRQLQRKLESMPQSDATTFGLGAFVPAADLVSDLKVGDIVEIDRTLYAHWAVHVGDGRVVHVAGPSEEDIPSEPWALVHLCPLTELAGCSRVRVNNKSVRAKERQVRPLDGAQVATRALAQRGHKLDFNFLTRNAEFYVTQWKYGQGWSDQICEEKVVVQQLYCGAQ
ncbi:group XVI phospholipase A1/A2-like [Tropilaelaps mercedesae]|uniref:Group XVI phospholipase A1/A2-like n=1 Tax=Tropilaelaps mercedesae TaxID=418985 RepID=A0A1V9XPA9_9ACAR|nr:group XVI phospholipase A1/A2-like [Tropilaelaps mercedesae]